MSIKLPKLNSITVSGRLTRDGEVRYLPNGTAVYKCSIAIDDGYFDKNSNQWVSQPVFMDVSVWGKQGEKAANELKKGSPIVVEGKLKQHSYKTQDGQNRTVTEIVANRIQSLEKSEGNNQSYDKGDKPSGGGSGGNGGGKPDYVNSDVPFI